MDDKGSKNDINKTDLIIFTHIPKTAGMSMFEIIKKQFIDDEILECFFHGDENIPSMKQEIKDKLKLLRGHVPYGLHKYFPNRNCKYFSLMRDPIDRIVSLFYYIKERPNHEFYEGMKDLSLIQFCKKYNTETSNLQSFFFTNKREPKTIEVKSAIINNFKFIGITEMFNESVLILKIIFGWNDCSYKIVNKTGKRRKIEELSSAEINYITHSNQIDIEIYNWLREKIQIEYNAILSKPINFDFE